MTFERRFGSSDPADNGTPMKNKVVLITGGTSGNW